MMYLAIFIQKILNYFLKFKKVFIIVYIENLNIINIILKNPIIFYYTRSKMANMAQILT